ncbi:MAG TPA: methionine--tRNA ligase [Thermomicrobiales bacterium]|nr:methionine--tRNA ligase [Thermomicrobiales bacterium]
MAGEPYYVTTSIPYVNARPHLGFALELVQADALARYHRLRGDDVRFLTGTDDNALKNVRAAEAAGVPVQAFVDRNAAAFAALRGPLQLSTDDFIRTGGNPRHTAAVQQFWRACERAGAIYRRTYTGLYCVGCEAYYADDELVAGRCPEHGTRPEVVAEENCFFRLSRYQDPLARLIESDTVRVVPATRRNEVLRFIRGGLEDFSISRSQERARGWGIPVPDDPSQVVYVWFDALLNYLSALDYGDAGPLYRRYWRDNPRRVHVIGKDILRFHAVYWPAMLLAAGEPLPTTIFVHEFITAGGARLSKTRGNVVDPRDLVARCGADALRYWLLREPTRTEDVDFSVARLLERYHADLANGIGNLLQRTLSMLWRYRDGIVPEPGPAGPCDLDCRAAVERLPEAVGAALAAFDFRAALVAVGDAVASANRYVEETAPWALAREATPEAAARLDTVLSTLAEALRLVAAHLAPFLPDAAERIAVQLGLPGIPADALTPAATRWGGLPPGTRVARPVPVFPRLEE